MSWGTVWNGVCLTAPITVSHSKGGECILSDILDKTVFDSKVRALSRDDYYQSPDFQCAQTGGYPTMLCINWDEEKAWLKPNEFVDPCGADVAEYEKLCADFGIRLCSDIEDFNGLLKELGPDAVENATLYEDEDFDLS